MELHVILLTLGAVFLAGLAADTLGRRTKVPRVTLLLLIGVMIGPIGLNLLPTGVDLWYELLASVALTMVAFLLGNSLTKKRLKEHGRHILIVSASVVIASLFLVGGGLILIGAPVTLALMLAAISTATAPGATYDVIQQSKIIGPFSKLLKGIVAVDDAWALIAFSLLLILAKALVGEGFAHILTEGAWEMGGAIALGLAIGVPAAFLTGRIQPGEPMQAEALGAVFLCAGLAVWLGVSFLLAGIIMGMTVANLARHHERAFHEIERVEWPFMLLFFVLAGASFDYANLTGLASIVIGFIVLRIVARFVGGWLGGHWSGLPTVQTRWIGAALLPQAGVAVGMALVAGTHFPDLRDDIIAITITTTIVFEIIGPLLTLMALRRTRE